MYNGTIQPTHDIHGNPIFITTSHHNNEILTFYAVGAARFWIELRDELFTCLGKNNRLPVSYVGPATKHIPEKH